MIRQLKATLPTCAITPLVVAVTTTGVMAKAATSALEDIGFTRAEVRKLCTECMRETLYKVKAMKAA